MSCVKKPIRIAALIIGLILTVSVHRAEAQRPIWEGAASIGSGASFGQGNGDTVIMASPTYLDVDIIYSSDERPTVEYVIGLQAELAGRVSGGIVPQVRLTNAPKKWLIYGLIGAPIVLVPFTMFGVEAGGGLHWRALPRFGPFAEVVVDLFMFGSDLPNNGMVIQLDANIGFRVVF